MIKTKNIVVVMPAYNAEKTLRKTYDEVMAATRRAVTGWPWTRARIS
jgi:glycosyltransferase involved in cell wall biosynthesis